MKINTMYLAKTGEAFRVISLEDGIIHLATFEGEFVLDGKIEVFPKFMKATGMKEIDEKEYKRRVVAMNLFQSSKHERDYPHKDSYLGEYETSLKISDEVISQLFDMDGGFKDYDLNNLIEEE